MTPFTPVNVQDGVNAMDLWVVLPPVHGEAVDRRRSRYGTTPEPQHRETLVGVVVLQDFPDAGDGPGVLLWSHVGGGGKGPKPDGDVLRYMMRCCLRGLKFGGVRPCVNAQRDTSVHDQPPPSTKAAACRSSSARDRTTIKTLFDEPG